MSSETFTFTSGGGEDYVALIVVPIVAYHYDQWIPEHKATEEVEEYKQLYGEENCSKVGDTIEGTFKDMDVNIQLNPANSCIPVSTYDSHNYYTNISRAAVLNISKQKHKQHICENGFCIICGKYQPAELNSNNVYEISNAEDEKDNNGRGTLCFK